MTPQQAIDKAGTVMGLARIMGVDRQSIQQYRKRGRFPEHRLQHLRELRPEWFNKAKEKP